MEETLSILEKVAMLSEAHRFVFFGVMGENIPFSCTTAEEYWEAKGEIQERKNAAPVEANEPVLGTEADPASGASRRYVRPAQLTPAEVYRMNSLDSASYLATQIFDHDITSDWSYRGGTVAEVIVSIDRQLFPYTVRTATMAATRSGSRTEYYRFDESGEEDIELRDLQSLESGRYEPSDISIDFSEDDSHFNDSDTEIDEESYTLKLQDIDVLVRKFLGANSPREATVREGTLVEASIAINVLACLVALTTTMELMRNRDLCVEINSEPSDDEILEALNNIAEHAHSAIRLLVAIGRHDIVQAFKRVLRSQIEVFIETDEVQNTLGWAEYAIRIGSTVNGAEIEWTEDEESMLAIYVAAVEGDLSVGGEA
jgi:hypothetical protein